MKLGGGASAPLLSYEDEETTCSGVSYPPATPWSSSSSSSTSSSSLASLLLPAPSFSSLPFTTPPFVSPSSTSSSSSSPSSSLLAPGSLHNFFPPFLSAPTPRPAFAPPPAPFTTLLPRPVPARPSVSLSSHTSITSPPLVPSSLSSSSLGRPPPPPPFSLPPPPCCSCSSLLPRLLSAHRLEVRRLLRGALASLGRRLDSLERSSKRRKRKLKKRRRGGAAPPPGPSAPQRPVSTSSSSSSSDNEESLTSSGFRQSESSRMRRKEEKSRRRCHREPDARELKKEVVEEEEEEERFVGRMAVSFKRGPQEEEPLTLHNFIQSKRRRNEVAGGGQSQMFDTVVMVKNGYKTSPVLLRHTSQHALHLLQSAQGGWTGSQSEAFTVSTVQWCFSDLTPPLPFCTNHGVLRSWVCSSCTFSPGPMLRLSAAAVGKLLETVRGGVCWSPLRPLKDWTAPPSLSSDHCYIRTASLSPASSARRQQRQRANHSARILHPLRRRAPPACVTNGLSAPLPVVEVTSKFPGKNGERAKRVSQIRIRRASPRETLLTPMGLPKVKRLKKKEFSLEEIYTNKNYKSPSTNRSLETIFEEPREKDGSMLLIGQQKRRRILLFPDFTQPRRRKKLQGIMGAGLAVAMAPRKRAAARRHVHGSDDDSDLDVMLVERLSALEDFLIRQGLET